MTHPELYAAVVLIAISATLFYLGSANQRLLSRALSAKLSAGAGTACGAVALVLLLGYSGPATAVYILLTGLMLLWTVVPLTIAYLRHRGEAD